MVTSQGNIGLVLANNESPCTVNNFVSLASRASSTTPNATG